MTKEMKQKMFTIKNDAKTSILVKSLNYLRSRLIENARENRDSGKCWRCKPTADQCINKDHPYTGKAELRCYSTQKMQFINSKLKNL